MKPRRERGFFLGGIRNGQPPGGVHTDAMRAAILCASVFLSACGGGGGYDGGSNPMPGSSFSIGGTVSGLTGTVVLQNNGADNLSISASGPFTFANRLGNGASYNVTVLTQPAGHTCTVSNGSGFVGTAYGSSNVAVTCT